jgi:hypothetical protein
MRRQFGVRRSGCYTKAALRGGLTLSLWLEVSPLEMFDHLNDSTP